MKRTFLYLFAGISLLSCQNNEPKSAIKDLEKIAELKSENIELKERIKEKDLIIKESLIFFSDIERSLNEIAIKENEIRLKSESKESTPEDKEWIKSQIASLKSLAEQSVKKMNNLAIKLNNSQIKIEELQDLLEEYALDMQSKNELVSDLEDLLSKKDAEYARLFDEYDKTTEIIDYLEDEINTVYYAVGTEKELIDNRVIVKNDGLLGFNKKIEIAEKVNDKYFDKINKYKKTEIKVELSKIKLISLHPTSSYIIENKDGVSVIKISNPAEFWKLSKFLIILAK